MDKSPEVGNLLEREEALNPHSRDFYNSRTRKTQLENSVVYYFDYSNDSSKDDEEIITWRELKELKDRRNWTVLRHPMVLNFVNEKLLERAIFYLIHIISYLLFLFLLSSYIFGKTPTQDVLATIFLIVFGFCLLVKGAVKLQHGKVSKWFVASYLFNIITYLCTFLFLWTPQLFAYDDYNHDLKQFITWFLPIIAIISAWVNFLYILRKSPSGIYILMMSRILYSFSQIAIIWVPTLLAFAFAFHLVMRNSETGPWEATEALSKNATFAGKLLAIFQAVTKTSTMMIGEVDADTVLERKEWIPNLLLIAFEVITVILLMNLMISLAVGDVNELRHSAQEKLLEIKVNFVIETLQLSEACDCFGDSRFSILHKKRTNNVLVVESDGDSYTAMKKLEFGQELQEVAPPVPEKPVQSTLREVVRDIRLSQAEPGFHVLRQCVRQEIGSGLQLSPSSPQESSFIEAGLYPDVRNAPATKVYYIHFPTDPHGVRLQKKSVVGRTVQMVMDGAIIQLIEGSDSGIKPFTGSANGEKSPSNIDDNEGCKKKFARWLIGLDWTTLVDF